VSRRHAPRRVTSILGVTVRFSILTPSDKEPVVAHIAGTASKDERNALARFEDSGSAFVFGKFTDKTKWKFYAQICGGNISPENIAHGKIPKEVKQLENLFDFG